MRSRWWKGLLAFALLLSSPTMAQIADLPSRADVAGSRAQPEYDPIGVQIGPSRVAPAMRVTLGYDSNVFGQQNDPSTDGFVVISPSLSAKTGWSRNEIAVSANADLTRYMTFNEQDTNEYSAQASGRIDIWNGAISPGISISRVAERRGTDGVPLTFGPPSLYRTFAQNIQAKQAFAHFTISVTGHHSNVDYSTLVLPSGTRVSQGFRDIESWGGETRISYAQSSAMALFVAGQFGTGKSPPVNPCCSRRGTTLNASAGVALDIGMFRGEIIGGYLQRTFSNPALPDFHGPNYSIQLYWYPTPLLTVELRSARTLENSGIINVGAIVARSDRIGLSYELLRNLIFRLEVVDRRDHFREIGVTSSTFHQQLQADFQFHRTVAFGAYERYECRDSSRSTAVRNYCAFVGGISMTVRR